MFEDSNPPTALTHAQWVRLRDNLFSKYPTPANPQEKAIRDIAKHMNTMQHYYSELYKEVGTSGRLIMEACLDLYGHLSSGGTDSTKIDAAHAAGQISEQTRDQLHELRKASNKGVHRHSAPFQPQDKVTVANATYTIGTMICSDFLLWGDLPTAAPTSSWTHQMAEETARITSELAKIQPVKKFKLRRGRRRRGNSISDEFLRGLNLLGL